MGSEGIWGLALRFRASFLGQPKHDGWRQGHAQRV